MQFDPSSVKEYERKIIAKGNYDFEVFDAENTVYEHDGESYEQIRLSLRVFYDDGSLIFSAWVGYCNTGRKMGLLKAFCKSVGMDEQWESGEISPDDCIGKAGIVKIGIWDGKNSINWFIESENKEKTNPKKALKAKTKAKEFYNAVDEEADGDDIPF